MDALWTVSYRGLGFNNTVNIFMSSSGGGISEEVSGDGNEIISSENREISVFHFTSLSERLADHEENQGYHNYVKYTLLAVILTCILTVIMYKCKTYKENNVRRRRVNENLDLVELHHDSLETHGMIKKQMTNRRRKEIERAREEKEEKKKQEKKKKGQEKDKERRKRRLQSRSQE